MVRAMTTKSRFSRLFTCAALVAAALIASPGGAISIDAARADTLSNTCRQWYPGAQVSNMIPCQSDDRNVDFCTVYPWPSIIGDRFGEAMANLDAQTVLYDTYMNPCGTQTDLGGHLSGQSGELVLPSNWLGLSLCTKLLWPAGAKCDQASIIFAPYHPNFSALSAASRAIAWRNTLCHEIGHGLGLPHDGPSGGCMVSGIRTSWSGYSTHHRDLINNAY